MVPTYFNMGFTREEIVPNTAFTKVLNQEGGDNLDVAVCSFAAEKLEIIETQQMLMGLFSAVSHSSFKGKARLVINLGPATQVAPGLTMIIETLCQLLGWGPKGLKGAIAICGGAETVRQSLPQTSKHMDAQHYAVLADEAAAIAFCRAAS